MYAIDVYIRHAKRYTDYATRKRSRAIIIGIGNHINTQTMGMTVVMTVCVVLGSFFLR